MPQISVYRMDRWGIFVRLPTQLGDPIYLCFFYVMHMSLRNQGIISIGTYNDNSREYHIDARGKDLASIMRAINAEDIEPVQEETKPSGLPFLVVEKLQELNLYSLQEFEDIYRKAVEGDAKTLASFLKKYSDLKVFDFKGKNKKQVFAELEDFFGDSITYKYPNFAAYF